MYFKITNKNISYTKNFRTTIFKIRGINTKLMYYLNRSMLLHPNTAITILNNENTKLIDLKHFFVLFEHFFETSILKKEEDQIKLLKTIKHYRGFKHIFGYPTRGQRNRTNASTAYKRTKKNRK